MNDFDQTVLGSIELAQSEALKRKNNELTEFHLLWGLLYNPATVSSKKLKEEKKVVKGLLEHLPTVKEISLSEAPNFAEAIINNQIQGRTLVKVN